MVTEVGQELREGSLCPKCQRNTLSIRFRTNVATRTKDRFLACSGYGSDDCSGFTWNLSSSAYQPSQRVLSQALVGARDVPGRPPLVKDMLAAKRVEEASETVETVETVETRRPTNLAEWFRDSKFLPEELLLSALSEVDSELADRHRELGSGKPAILREVRARITANGGDADV